MNVAEAGRAVPLKWRLADLGNNPVTNLAPAAVQVTSGGVSCDSMSQPTDLVEEYATGTSGLQNLGDGNYQFNWATDQAYAGTCRRLRLDVGERLEDGTTPIYHTADFQFSK